MNLNIFVWIFSTTKTIRSKKILRLICLENQRINPICEWKSKGDFCCMASQRCNCYRGKHLLEAFPYFQCSHQSRSMQHCLVNCSFNNFNIMHFLWRINQITTNFLILWQCTFYGNCRLKYNDRGRNFHDWLIEGTWCELLWIVADDKTYWILLI